MSENENHFDELMNAFIESDANEHQLGELLALVKKSPERRQQFQREARINSMLRETVSEQIELQALQVASEPPSGSVLPRRGPRKRVFWFLALAGTTLIAVGLAWLVQANFFQDQRPVVGICLNVTGLGDLTLTRGKMSQPITRSMPLRVGDRIGCGSETQAQLRLGDGSILAMESDAILTFVSEQPKIRLQQGEVLFEVAERSSKSLPFQVETDESTVDVLGTIFSLDSFRHTELKVYEGEVTLTRLSDQAQVHVASQQQTTTEGLELNVQSIQQPSSDGSVSVISLLPTDDLTIERGNSRNNTYLKVEGDRRTSYLRFDIPSQVKIRNARLRLTQSVDTGSGTLAIHLGDHSDWDEMDSLKRSQLPVPERLLGTRKGTVGRGHVIELEFSGTLPSGSQTVILTLQDKGENDIWFASKESNTPPQLLLTVDSE